MDSLVLSVWTDSQAAQVRGLRGDPMSGPWSVTFSSLACVTSPNWGVVGSKPAPGTTFGCLASIVGIFRYQGKAETGDWGTGKERGRRSAAHWAHVQQF